jgi:hypothetical protein
VAERACATVLLCAYRSESHNFDYVISIDAMGGGKPPFAASAKPWASFAEAVIEKAAGRPSNILVA